VIDPAYRCAASRQQHQLPISPMPEYLSGKLAVSYA
jgi:hypothetical protein